MAAKLLQRDDLQEIIATNLFGKRISYLGRYIGSYRRGLHLLTSSSSAVCVYLPINLIVLSLRIQSVGIVNKLPNELLNDTYPSLNEFKTHRKLNAD